MPVYALGDVEPGIHPDAYVHPDAVVIGSVTIGAEASIWPTAVLRGDDGRIEVGPRTSVQDGSIIHCTATQPTIIGAEVTVGHNVHIEGATIGDRALISSGSVVLNGAVSGAGAVVAAGAVVSPGAQIPAARWRWASRPGCARATRCRRATTDHPVQSYGSVAGGSAPSCADWRGDGGKPLAEIVEAGWAKALAPVAPVIADMGEFLRAELAAGPALPAGRGERAARVHPAVRRRSGC